MRAQDKSVEIQIAPTPYDYLNEACRHICKNKKIYMCVENFNIISTEPTWAVNRGNSTMTLAGIPQLVYNVTLRIYPSYTIECVFYPNDFKSEEDNLLVVDSAAGIDIFKDENTRVCARLIYMLYRIYKIAAGKITPSINSIDAEVGCRIKTITREL